MTLLREREDEGEETNPRLHSTPTTTTTAPSLRRRSTSSRMQVVPGHTPNREYHFPAGMPVLLQLSRAVENYYEDEGVIPSAMHILEDAYSEVASFLRKVPSEMNGLPCYWTEIYGPDSWLPVVVGSVRKNLSPHTVKCIGRSQTGSLPRTEQQQQQQQSVRARRVQQQSA